IVFLKLSGNAGALGNKHGRGFGATVGAVLGMVQWVTPELLIAAVVGGVFFSWKGDVDDRRWGLLALGALGIAGALIFASGLRNDIYADYGMAMLPVVFLTVGALAARAMPQPAPATQALATAAVAVLAVAELPGLASNLRDGMRFDYRPAFAYV